MGIGKSVRRVFETTILKKLGNQIIIYRTWGTDEMSSFETLGRKETEHGKTVFEFKLGTEIYAGDVIQIQGSRDFWRVDDVEDEAEYGELIKLIAYVTKIDQQGNPIRVDSKGRAIFNITARDVYGAIQIDGQNNAQTVTTTINRESISEILPKLIELINEVAKADFENKEDVVKDLEKVHQLASSDNPKDKWLLIQAKLTSAKTAMELVGFAYHSLPYWPQIWDYFIG